MSLSKDMYVFYEFLVNNNKRMPFDFVQGITERHSPGIFIFAFIQEKKKESEIEEITHSGETESVRINKYAQNNNRSNVAPNITDRQRIH